ncbi:MAG: hypothetical protein WGN25_10560 [Candidatus Electrothrix sp. GW3-4]|uniref:hypothetical protein n=1 Tax=Candidatus Electrothrix sp. GW3-4 TaxID=3126740 RepID=UPI0030CE0E44
MAAIQWRPVPNHLTTPDSYSICFVSRGSAGLNDLASDITLHHPNFSKDDIITILHAEDEAILERLLNGEQVTKEGSLSWFPSFTGRLDNPDDPLPPLDECLHLNTRISAPFLEHLRQEAQTERLPMREKLPVITAAEDTVLGLRDVLRSDGMLRLTGNNLSFDRNDIGSHCLIEGTRSGSAVQSRVGTIANSEIVLMPDVPSQDDPWNNEYRLSVTTHYTEHGTPRTGTYKRMLRSPLSITLSSSGPPANIGILTGSATAPHVSVTGATMSEDTSLRIQVIQDLPGNRLLFNLLDMDKDGQAGEQVSLTTDGSLSLSGFTGSPLSSLALTVNDYAALWEMLRKEYGGRLVDTLDITST